MAENTTLPRYTPSGFFRPLTFALFLAATLGGALVAWGYQILMDWMPLIYLSILVCMGFGFALGFAGAWAIKTGHCRNRMIALLLALPLLAGSLAATYYWEFHRALSEFHERHPDADLDQITFKMFLDDRRERGWQISNHGSSGTPIKGDVIWGLWFIEGVLILGTGGVLIWRAVNEPYCERCNQWGTPKKMLLPGLKRGDAEPLLSAGDLDGVIGLPLPPDGSPQVALALTATLCPMCKETGFLTVEEKQVVARKKGKPQEKTTKLIVHAVLRADQREKFIQRLAPGPAAPAAAAGG
jgi:hypothetical protein